MECIIAGFILLLFSFLLSLEYGRDPSNTEHSVALPIVGVLLIICALVLFLLA